MRTGIGYIIQIGYIERLTHNTRLSNWHNFFFHERATIDTLFPPCLAGYRYPLWGFHRGTDLGCTLDVTGGASQLQWLAGFAENRSDWPGEHLTKIHSGDWEMPFTAYLTLYKSFNWSVRVTFKLENPAGFDHFLAFRHLVRFMTSHVLASTMVESSVQLVLFEVAKSCWYSCSIRALSLRLGRDFGCSFWRWTRWTFNECCGSRSRRSDDNGVICEYSTGSMSSPGMLVDGTFEGSGGGAGNAGRSGIVSMADYER